MKNLKRKLGYGVADIYGGGAFLIINVMFMNFALKNLIDAGMDSLVAAAWISAIMLVGRVWDAVTDPIMGVITDRTSSRFGKRRVFLLIGSPLAFISYFLLWSNFGISDGGLLVAYYFGTYLLFSTVITLIMVPYNSILPEMEKDYSTRTSFTAVRMVFSVGGAALAGLLPGMIVGGSSASPNWTAENFTLMGAIFGALFAVSVFLCFLGTKTPKTDIPTETAKKDKVRPFADFGSVFKNKAFRRYLPLHIFGQGMADFLTTLIVCFLAVYYKSDSYIIIMATMLITQILSMLVLPRLSTKFGKTAPVFVGFGLLIVTLLAALFINQNTPLFVFVIVAFICGVGTSSGTLVPYSILPDMSDVDELITGKRREGIYSGVATFARKLVNGVTVSLIALLTGLAGYVPAPDASFVYAPEVTTAIKLLFIIGPIVMMLLTMFFARRFKLTKEAHMAVLKEVAHRKAHEGESIATEEQQQFLQDLTGVKFEKLWGKE